MSGHATDRLGNHRQSSRTLCNRFPAVAAASGRRAGLLALAAYALLAFCFWGIGPLVEHGNQYVGVFDDPQIPIWSFAWWLHAIEHGSNPLYTHEIWAPTGVDLA